MNTKTYAAAVNRTVGLVATFEASGYREARCQLVASSQESIVKLNLTKFLVSLYSEK